MRSAYLENTLKYNPELCTGCGLCSAVCPHGVFAPDGGAALLVRREACMECGACQKNCASGAIQVDSGVGCATGTIRAFVRGEKEATCGGNAEPCCRAADR